MTLVPPNQFLVPAQLVANIQNENKTEKENKLSDRRLFKQ